MKIEGGSPNRDSAAIERAGRTQPERTKDTRDARSVSQTDRVELSADATLAGLAQRAAEDTPEIRRDLVARMRAKLDAGEVGADAERLADRLIDHLLDQ